jgi:hypothetical protein
MSLIKCHECGGQMSTDAKACPSCGALPRKKTSRLTWTVLALMLFGLFVGAFNSATKPSPSATSATSQATPDSKPKDPKRDGQLQAAGSAAQALKRASKDPTTFEMKEAVVKEDGTACFVYRAQNSFGAHLTGEAVLTTKGKLLVHEQHGNKFVDAWNKSCTKPGGDDIVDLMKRLDII